MGLVEKLRRPVAGKDNWWNSAKIGCAVILFIG